MAEQPQDNDRRWRPIRSFVRREGRLTEGQQRALDQLWPRFGIDFDGQPLDLPAIFGNDHPVVLEIGFGNGESLARMAQANPERNYLGIEVHRPGVGHLLMAVEKHGLENLRVMCHDAQEIVEQSIADSSLGGVQLYFPDPWPKKRHHKRRIVQPAWVAQIHRKLAPGGYLHMATDWENYAEHMLEVMEAAEGFENTAGPGKYLPRPDFRPVTKFEQRGQRLGHGVWDLYYVKSA